MAGKSAQFPLHTWLPDAMAGPTPISALIHAATMVAAGVYVVARLYPLFLAAPARWPCSPCMAAVTMLLGALAAIAQDDIKRVLAWSTVSPARVHDRRAGGRRARRRRCSTCSPTPRSRRCCSSPPAAVIHAVGTNSMSAMGGLRRAHAGDVLVR